MKKMIICFVKNLSPNSKTYAEHLQGKWKAPIGESLLAAAVRISI